jgi:tRNA(Ile)-lysidine synthase TilS/MesJ
MFGFTRHIEQVAMKQILGGIRKAVEEYDMIQDGDKIVVGISGGKDSMVLLYGMKLFQRFSPVKYDLAAVTIGMGFENFDTGPIAEFCKKIDVPYYVVDTDIAEIIFDIRKEKNPCALCAKMRRGALHDKVKELGFNKVALGHHADDALETLFLSMFYEGRVSTFKPVTYLSNKDIHCIRPMLLLKEAQIEGVMNRHDIALVKSPCPMDRHTKREDMKILLKSIYKDIPQGRDRLIRAIRNKEQLSLWF